MAKPTNTYSDRELEGHFSDVKEALEKQNVTLAQILAQATKTNGRVSRLEDWRTAIAWGFGFMVTAIMFVVNYLK